MILEANHLTLLLRMIDALLVNCQISDYHFVHGYLDESQDGLVRQVAHHVLDSELSRGNSLLFGLLGWWRLRRQSDGHAHDRCLLLLFRLPQAASVEWRVLQIVHHRQEWITSHSQLGLRSFLLVLELFAALLINKLLDVIFLEQLHLFLGHEHIVLCDQVFVPILEVLLVDTIAST